VRVLALQLDRNSGSRIGARLVDEAGVSRRSALVGVAEQVLDSAQVVRVLVGERGPSMAERVVRDARSLQVETSKVGVDDGAHAAAAQALAAGAIADGGHERLAECVGGNLAASLEVGIQRLRNVLPQIDQSIVAFAAHEQRSLVVATLQIVNIGARDLDGAQHLQAEQSQQRFVAQVLDARLSKLSVRCGTARSRSASSPSLR
jgi:hypothetical protein